MTPSADRRTSDGALLARLSQQVDELTRTVTSLAAFVQTKIATSDATLETLTATVRRLLDVTWPQHERHHDGINGRIGAVELAISKATANADAIAGLSLRLQSLETLKTRGEGAAWLARGVWVIGGAVATYALTHGLHL